MKRLAMLGAVMALCAGAISAQQVVAHRGYWKTDGSAQNSIRSLVKADSIGAYGSEFDVWMLTDGPLVVNHDRTFKGVNFETDTYSKVQQIVLDNGESVPTLDEYLAEFTKHPKTRVVLEMKSLTDLTREDEMAKLIVASLRKYDLLDRTDIIAFSINACIAFKKLLPVGVPIYYLDGDIAPKKIAKLGLAGMDYSMKALRKHPDWIADAHKRGLKVNVWTVDEDEDIQYFIESGVDFITTNQPVKVQKMISDNAAKSSKKKK
jgi:glycerophosphoryl diester phosphodiesterase